MENQNGKITAAIVTKDAFRSVFKYDYKNMTKGALISVVLINLFIYSCVFIVGKSILTTAADKIAQHMLSQPAAVPLSKPNEIVDVLSGSVGGADSLKLTGYWKPNDRHSYNQNGYELFLAQGKERIRFDYSHPVPFPGPLPIELVFSLGGEIGGNFQFGRLGLYELTIGDGDYNTITVRDYKHERVKDTSSDTSKPRLNSKIMRDITCSLVLEEKVISDKEFELLVNLNGQVFSFVLPLPSKWKERDDIFFGLVDYSLGENKTSVYWYEPEVASFLNY